MAAGQPAQLVIPDLGIAGRHAALRFAVGTTGPFVLGEAMGWQPSFLAPLLAAVLIANLPGRLPPKVGVILVVVQALGAFLAYALAATLHESPLILFGTIGLILFICFANLAKGGETLPILLVLISFATIPIVTMFEPRGASALPVAFFHAMVLAVLSVWLVHAIWPVLTKAGPATATIRFDRPLRVAATGTAIVMPLMLFYLMYAITDALPILITTIVLIINFDPRRSSTQSLAMMMANFVGGIVALLAQSLLLVVPNLVMLTVTVFIIAATFALPIGRGGPAGAVALVTFNQAMVMFSLALTGESNLGLWGTRLLQFLLAGIFAVGMMSLLFRPAGAQR